MRMTERERPLWQAGALVGGVDEAGRGPLAGPVVAACVVMPPEPLLPDINDSKKVAEKKREALCEEILRCAVSVGVGVASVEEIESLNIKQAARRAGASRDGGRPPPGAAPRSSPRPCRS